MIKAVFHAFQVLRVGQQLSKPDAWKNVQLVASLLTALLGLLWALGVHVVLLPDEIFAVAGAIVALLNGYVTVATTRKIGLPPIDLVAEPDLEPVLDAERVRESAVSPPHDSEARRERRDDSGFNG